MGLNDTPRAGRVHIGLFGRRNAGKSSLLNALAGQPLAVVSDIKGTTTDPVLKAMEILPLGPVVLIDTPGLDDTGALGELRVQKAREALDKTDIALLVFDAQEGMQPADKALLDEVQARGLPFLLVANKMDALPGMPQEKDGVFYVSAQSGQNLHALRERVARLVPAEGVQRQLVADLLHPNDLVVLVTPIDSAAPKGRMILPQQQTIRDILDAHAIAVTTQTGELAHTLRSLGRPPAMVITDSQAFAEVAPVVPDNVPLTSFSILFARYKGILETAVRGVRAVDTLRDGDRVLISEGCTHHRQCEDIGTVKLPAWIRRHTGKHVEFSFTSGGGFEQELSPYRLVVHCGGCMLGDRAVLHRLQTALEQETPMTNYGILIAYMQGILARSVALFPHISAWLHTA